MNTKVVINLPTSQFATRRSLWWGLFVLAMGLFPWVAVSTTANAQMHQRWVDDQDGVGVIERTGVQLPLDLGFTDDQGNRRLLFDLFDGTRPVLLSLNYSDCPMLCSVQFTNLTNTLKGMGFRPETDFQIVSISLDPTETPARARDTKNKYVSLYDRPETANGWHFLVGQPSEIRRVSETIGFKYKRIENGHFVHPPLIVLCSPSGKVVRYIHGLEVDAGVLEQALIEAAEGKIGSPINRFLFACYQFNSATGHYSPNAVFLMKLGGAATVLVLVASLVPYWVRRTGHSVAVADDRPLIEFEQV
ncbi:MAG: SCO family protein [Pirellulaceae bacterium]|nr:SCO family protein [Pirellulaceae bacterium]